MSDAWVCESCGGEDPEPDNDVCLRCGGQLTPQGVDTDAWDRFEAAVEAVRQSSGYDLN